MPLPALLAARLKSRGIISQEQEIAEENAEEEVFVESYDDDTAVHDPHVVTSKKGAPGCPNKSNPYHRCTIFCWEYWGGGISLERIDEEHRDVERRRRRMLRRYPLGSDWEEVFDSHTSRYYYWNTETDQVSWLAPDHPRAVITHAAGSEGRDQGEGKRREQQRGDKDRGRARDEPRDPPRDRERNRDRSSRDNGGRHRRAPKRPHREEELDPMDPAAYGDVERGTWHSGLATGVEAKTGVDQTASGPLFQMRPYPAPGAVMRHNQEQGGSKPPAAMGGPVVGPPVIGPLSNRPLGPSRPSIDESDEDED